MDYDHIKSYLRPKIFARMVSGEIPYEIKDGKVVLADEDIDIFQTTNVIPFPSRDVPEPKCVSEMFLDELRELGFDV